MRQKFVFVTAIAVCAALALVPAFASERTVDRYGDRAKTAKVRGANGYEPPHTAEIAQRITTDSRMSNAGLANAEKAAAMISAAAKQNGNQAISTLQQVVTMDLGTTDQADKIRSGAHEMLANLYEGTPSKQVKHLGMALQFSSDPSHRARIESRIATLGGDVFAIAFQQNGNTTVYSRDAGADDTCAGAVAVALPHSEVMSITPSGDANWRSFDITGAGATMRIETISDFPGSFTDDTDLTLYDGCGGTQLAFNDDKGSDFTSRIDTGCLGTGTYYVEVGGFFDSATPDDFTLEIEATSACVPPSPDSFEPDDARADASSIGYPTHTSGNGWGRAKKEIQGHNIFPSGDQDHAVATLTQNELVSMKTAGQFPTFFNGFSSSAVLDNPDTILTLLYENEPDYGGRCNQPTLGYLPVCFSDADCPDPLVSPLPGFPPCIPIQLFNVPVGFENPLITNDDAGGGNFGSSVLACLPRTASGSPSATLQSSGGNWLVRVNAFSASDNFDYEVQVKNEVGCLFEQEPNNDFPDATPLAVTATRTAGIYDFAVTNPSADVDLYQFDVPATQTVRMESFGPDNLQSDTAFELYVGPDDAGDFFFTGVFDDDAGPGFLSRITITLPPASALLGNVSADADYFLNSTSFYYNPNFYYQLHVRPFPLTAQTESEPNNDNGQANLVTVGQTISGTIGGGCDFDTYRISLQTATFVEVLSTSGGDSAIQLVNCGSGSVLACDDDSAGSMLPMVSGCLPAGEYCAQVRAFSPGDTFAYDLQFNGSAGCVPTVPPTVTGDSSFTCLAFDTCN